MKKKQKQKQLLQNAALLNGLYAPDVHAPHAPHAHTWYMYMNLMLMRCKEVCNAVASLIKL